MVSFINIYGVNTITYKVNPELIACIFKDPFDDTTVVLSGGFQIKTKSSVEDITKLIKEPLKG